MSGDHVDVALNTVQMSTSPQVHFRPKEVTSPGFREHLHQLKGVTYTSTGRYTVPKPNIMRDQMLQQWLKKNYGVTRVGWWDLTGQFASSGMGAVQLQSRM